MTRGRTPDPKPDIDLELQEALNRRQNDWSTQTREPAYPATGTTLIAARLAAARAALEEESSVL